MIIGVSVSSLYVLVIFIDPHLLLAVEYIVKCSVLISLWHYYGYQWTRLNIRYVPYSVYVIYTIRST